MVTVAYGPHVKKTIRKIRDHELKERVKTRIVKIVNNPSILKTPALQPKANKGSVYPPVGGCPICITNVPIRLSFYLSITKANNTAKVSCNVSVAKTGVF